MRFFKHLGHAVDQTASHATFIELLNPICAIFFGQALIDFLIQGVSVHGATGLVVITWIGDPLRGFLNVAKTLPNLGAKNGDVHVAVAGFVDASGNAGGMKVAGLGGHFLIDEPSGGLKVHHVNHGLQQ